MNRILLLFGVASAFVGVVAGAFGAHGLESRLSADLLAVYETGVRYELYHAIAALFTVLAADRWPSAGWARAGWLFIAGTVLFSGSLYALALTGITRLGAVTPFGGLLFLGGWALAGVAALRSAGGSGSQTPRDGVA